MVGKKDEILLIINLKKLTLDVSLKLTCPSHNPQAFGSHEEMIDSIRDRASIQNPDKEDRANAKAVLDKLFEKSLKGQSEAHKPFSYEMDKETSLAKCLAEKYQTKKKI